MMMKKLAPALGLVLLLVVTRPAVYSDAVAFKAQVTDSANNQYSLSDVTISGTSVLHFRLRDAAFTLPFEKIQSVTITNQGTSPFPGYVGADLVTSGGNTTHLFVNTENYRIEGIESNLGITLKIPLTDIQRLTFVPPPPSPTPSPSLSPSPSPTNRPTTTSPGPSPSASPSARPYTSPSPALSPSR